MQQGPSYGSNVEEGMVVVGRSHAGVPDREAWAEVAGPNQRTFARCTYGLPKNFKDKLVEMHKNKKKCIEKTRTA
jgi:hypothetical protein